MKNPFETLPVERTPSQVVFSEWCKMFGVDSAEISKEIKSDEKITMYDSAFKLGAQKFLAGFLSQIEGTQIEITALKTELDSLRAKGDLVALGKKEQEINRVNPERFIRNRRRACYKSTIFR